MFHVAGTANVFACTWVGAPRWCCRASTPRRCSRAIERERITHTALVPTMLAMLLDAPGGADADLSSLRNVQYAASPISPELQRRVLDRLDCEVAQFYGMTEAAPTVSQLSPADHRRGRRGAHRAAGVDGHAGARRRGRDPRRAGRAARAGSDRRAVGPRPERDARLLEPSGGDRGRDRRRLVPHRRRRLRRRGRLPVHGRPRSRT